MDLAGPLLLGRDGYHYWQFKRAKKASRRYGFEVYKSHLNWLRDPDYIRAQTIVAERNITGIPNDRCYMLLELCRQLKDVPGDMAECGVRYGKSTVFLLTGRGQEAKTLHLFDSFAGLSRPSAEDRPETDTPEWEEGELAVPIEMVRANLKGLGNRIEFHQGWIPERFSDVEGQKFSLVHLDVDLYEPTLESLKFFHPRMSPGGIFVCDDYGSAYCPGAKRAMDEYFADRPEKVLPLTTGQSIAIVK
jgi:hypothetical protein